MIPAPSVTGAGASSGGARRRPGADVFGKVDSFEPLCDEDPAKIRPIPIERLGWVILRCSSVRCCLRCLLVVSLTVALAVPAIFYTPDFLLGSRAGVWRNYIFAGSPALWDDTYRHAPEVAAGGLWKYQLEEVAERPEAWYLFLKKGRRGKKGKNYSSLWDPAVNVGLNLASLTNLSKGKALHYGSDISPMMVNAAKHNCPLCTNVSQFDFGILARPGMDARQAETLLSVKLGRGKFDIILVESVLYYIPWAGIPPLLLVCGYWPCAKLRQSSFVQANQRRFLDILRELAFDEVIVSLGRDVGEGALAVEEMMSAYGQGKRVRKGSFQAWLLPGLARRENP